jgi:type IV secretion system protein VirB1
MSQGNDMDAATLLSLLLACAPEVHPDTAFALVKVESALNPWAIGVVGKALRRQPRNRTEALASARQLQSNGRNFSVGLAQINVHNFARLGLTLTTAFDPCTNLGAMQTVLTECFDRASLALKYAPAPHLALRRSLSCYYSGNFSTGFRHGYVGKVVAAAASVQPAFTTPPVPFRSVPPTP